MGKQYVFAGRALTVF